MKKLYDEKRNFSVTPEPGFEEDPFVSREGPLVFVVQRHEASRLHFDFRLECDGALVSWAVPKGPSLDPKVKRAAIMVEDHPLDYAGFEGRIPKGQYGGGEVLVWDEGTYEPEDATGDRVRDEALVKRGLADGKLSFVLHGTRLKGEFVLVRTRKADQWLLIKGKDRFASEEDVARITTSVRTGLTAEDLREGRRKHKPSGAAEGPPPRDVKAMAPVEIGHPFSSELWSFELKLDGIRAIALKESGRVRILSRNGNDITNRFRGIAWDLESIPDRDFVLDGEIVLLDDHGRPTFQGLMKSFHGERGRGEPRYLVFDALYADGLDLRRCALSDRREVLDRIGFQGAVRAHDCIQTDGEVLFDEALKLGFEGIVGKKLSSPYREGARSDDWIKVKGYHTEEFLVCGYTRGFGAREHTFGALLLGRRDADGLMRYCGSVGGGFSDSELRGLRSRLDGMRIAKSPFAERITTKGEPVFVRPELIAEVRFMAWTAERRLRFPTFKRLREDLDELPPDPSLGTVGADEADAILEALESGEEEVQVTIDGNPVRFTSLSKRLWPEFTKRDLLVYLARVSGAYLEHLRDRPLTFVRYPDGVLGEGFFQRHWDEGLPEFVQTVRIWSESGGEARRHLLCNNLATLMWLGQVAAIELHPWHSRVVAEPDAMGLGAEFATSEDLEDSVLDYPDYLVCDLDPHLTKKGELTDDGWMATSDAALSLRDMLEDLGLRSFVKTTGKSGLHVFVPMRRIYDNDQVREAARTIGRFLAERMPSLVTVETSVRRRPRKVFFDAGMNGRSKTLACAFSPRPVADGRVSMPVEWDRLPYVRPEAFTLGTVPKILADGGDPWRSILDHRQMLGTP